LAFSTTGLRHKNTTKRLFRIAIFLFLSLHGNLTFGFDFGSPHESIVSAPPHTSKTPFEPIASGFFGDCMELLFWEGAKKSYRTIHEAFFDSSVQ